MQAFLNLVDELTSRVSLHDANREGLLAMRGNREGMAKQLEALPKGHRFEFGPRMPSGRFVPWLFSMRADRREDGSYDFAFFYTDGNTGIFYVKTARIASITAEYADGIVKIQPLDVPQWLKSNP
jgi:hypothetical protein